EHQEQQRQPEEQPAGEKAVVPVVGCPGRDEFDELSLYLLKAMLEPSGYHVEVLPNDMLASEMLAKVAECQSPVVCIGSLPPGGLAPVRYLCKRIRARCPAAKIVVGRWG